MTKDFHFDLAVKIINFVKIPIFYFIISFFDLSVDEIVNFSTNMSLVLWICSILSFGYLDYMCREITFFNNVSDRLIFINERLVILICFTLFSFIFFQILSLFKIWGNDVENTNYLLLIVALSLFCKNAIANIMRSLGFFHKLFLISCFEVIIFIGVGVGFLALYFLDSSLLFVNLGASGFFLMTIFTYIFDWRNLKLNFFFSHFFDFRVLSSLLYLNVFWGTSYLLKTEFGELRSFDIYFLDLIFLAIFPTVAMIVSYLHIKNFIDRSSKRLNYVCSITMISISVISLFLYVSFDTKFYSILLSLFSLVIMVEIFGFNILIFAVLGFYGVILTSILIVFSFEPFFYLLLLYGVILTSYPFGRGHIDNIKLTKKEIS